MLNSNSLAIISFDVIHITAYKLKFCSMLYCCFSKTIASILNISKLCKEVSIGSHIFEAVKEPSDFGEFFFWKKAHVLFIS